MGTLHNPQLKLDNQICFTIYAASREITKLYQPHLDKLGITYSQYIVFLVLWERGACTVKELGDALYLDSGTLTPLLKRLQAAGYINRERSTEDERKVIISLTEKGQELKKKAESIPGLIQQATCLSLDEYGDLLGKFKDLLYRVHEHNVQDHRK